MWDGGVNHLEMQPINPITSPEEMGETLANVLLKLQRSKSYKTLFYNAFGDSSVSTERIFRSLAQFTGLMISASSKYDQQIKGEYKYTLAEQSGFKIYQQK